MVMCFAPTCKHYSEKHGCKFFRFPKDQNTLKQWLQLIRRKDRDPSNSSRICDCHFTDGKVENKPTLFDYNVEKRFKISPNVGVKRRRKNKVLDEDQLSVPRPTHMQDPYDIPGPSTFYPCDVAQQLEEMLTEEPEKIPSDADEPQEREISPQLVAATKAENYFLKREINLQPLIDYRKKKVLDEDQLSVPRSTHMQDPYDIPGPSTFNPCDVAQQLEEMLTEEPKKIPSDADEPQEREISPQLVAATKAENYFLKQEIDLLKVRILRLKSEFRV